MKFADARKLHNGDEVIAKDTGETVNHPRLKPWAGEWLHSEIK